MYRRNLVGKCTYTIFCINCVADVLESVALLGSIENNILLLFNSSLVCHLVLDQEYGCIALVGCYTIQLSLHRYQDDQLPDSPGPLASCTYVSPLLFALTESGIVCILVLKQCLVTIMCVLILHGEWQYQDISGGLLVCNYNVSEL